MFFVEWNQHRLQTAVWKLSINKVGTPELAQASWCSLTWSLASINTAHEQPDQMQSKKYRYKQSDSGTDKEDADTYN
jgi:hypothetical protein